jgi:hypothetical protein
MVKLRIALLHLDLSGGPEKRNLDLLAKAADSWFVDKAKVLKDKGAEVLTVPAAWPPGEWGPGDCWERCSQVSGLPVWACNQTGNQEALDFSQAQSVVVAAGKTQFSYSGLQQAVLLFDWDCSNNCTASRQFTVLALN